MSNTISLEETNLNTENASLVSSFHRVESLIPDDQELKTIPPETRVADALKIMQRNHFSQLPVVAGDAVLGIFSYRSFSAKALAKQKSSKLLLGDLPVEDFLEEFEYTHANDDWNRVLRYLNQEDAFLVGHSNYLQGMVTTMDMLGYFQEIATPFIVIAEIELSLRQIIQTCIDSKTLPEAIRKSLKTAYPEKVIPTNLNQMTFDNYVQIISNGENWLHFKQMFGDQERARKQTNQKLQQLGQWRNIIFHFRRRLEQWELETMAEHREWLHRRVRAFEGRRRKAEKSQLSRTKSKSTATKSKQTPQRFLQRLEFWNQLLEKANVKTNLHARISPSKDHWISAGAGRSGLHYSYTIRMHDAQVDFGIYTSNKAENKRLFGKLMAHKDKIEKDFGRSLIWYNPDDKILSSVRHIIPDGGLRNIDQWPYIQDKMIEAMIRLEKSLRPYIQGL